MPSCSTTIVPVGLSCGRRGPDSLRARCFGASSLPSINASYMTTLAVTSVNSLLGHASTCFRIGSKFRCIRSTPTEMESMSEGDFECFASTGVKTPVAMSSNFRSVRFNFLEADLVRNDFQIARSPTAFLDRWRPRPATRLGSGLAPSGSGTVRIWLPLRSRATEMPPSAPGSSVVSRSGLA